jgi:integrase
VKLFKRDGFFHVKFTDPGGKVRKLSTLVKVSEGEKAAERAASSRISAALTDGHAKERLGAPSVKGLAHNLAEALEHTYLTRWQGTKQDVQLKYVVRRLEREVGFWLLTEIDYKRLKDLRDGWIKDGLAPATVNRRMSALKVALKEHAREAGTVRPEFPDTLPENNVRERYLTAQEEARVREFLAKQMRHEDIEDVPTASQGWSYIESLFTLLLDTGVRLSEALTLQGTDGKSIHLKHGTTKSGKGRVVPLTPRASVAAQCMLTSDLHGNLNYDWIGHRWDVVRAACAIPDVNLHILRHTCASRLLAAGVDLYTVSKWLGHSSVKMTERYAHLQQGALEQAVAALARRPVAVVSTEAPAEARTGTRGTRR